MKNQTLILNILDENQWDVFSLEMLCEATKLDKSELHSAFNRTIMELKPPPNTN